MDCSFASCKVMDFKIYEHEIHRKEILPVNLGII